MNTHILNKTAWWSGSIIAVLLLALVIHIAMVTPKANKYTYQLSRIDFKQQVDEAGAAKIRAFVAGLPGVKSTYFNPESNTLVYTYLISAQNSANVYDRLMESGHYKAERYIVDNSSIQNGCPINADNSTVTGRMMAFASGLFN
jgi:hypothetical protein